MVYNTTSTKNIIAKILRDLDIQEENSRITDWVEWIGEGLSKIGGVKTLNIKVTGKEDIPLLEVKNYQAKLPNDFISLVGVAFSPSITGSFAALRYGTGSFNAKGGSNINSTANTTASTNNIITLTMELYDLTYSEALEALNNDDTLSDKMSTLLINEKSITSQEQTNPTKDYTYVINSNYIKLNIKEGYLMLAYGARSIDEDGYPLIPDSPMHAEALYWYVVYKYLYPKWLSGQVRDRVMDEAKRSWGFYRKAAYAEAMLPNADQLESLKNQSLKLYPEINDHANFFATSGEQQTLYSNNLR